MSDPVLDRISEALDLFNAGRRAEARAAFTAIWAEIEAIQREGVRAEQGAV